MANTTFSRPFNDQGQSVTAQALERALAARATADPVAQARQMLSLYNRNAPRNRGSQTQGPDLSSWARAQLDRGLDPDDPRVQAAAQLMGRGGGSPGIVGSGDAGRARAAVGDRMAMGHILGQAGKGDYALAGLLGVGAQLEGNQEQARYHESQGMQQQFENRMAERGMGLSEFQAGMPSPGSTPTTPPTYDATNPTAVLMEGVVEKARHPGFFWRTGRTMAGLGLGFENADAVGTVNSLIESLNSLERQGGLTAAKRDQLAESISRMGATGSRSLQQRLARAQGLRKGSKGASSELGRLLNEYAARRAANPEQMQQDAIRDYRLNTSGR